MCPTYRVPILPNKFSVVAAGVASKLLHLCKFQGCKVKMTLTKVKIHEVNVKTVMIRIGGIPNLNKLYVSRWDGKKPIVFQSS